MSMSIDKKPGDKIRTTRQSLRNGSEMDKAMARDFLKPERIYTIKEISVGETKTTVKVTELPKVLFNSVLFDDL